MTENTITNAALDLSAHFPDWVQKDERAGYEGFIVLADHLLEVAGYLRDDLGFNFLSSVTGVDYLPEGILEVVYHLYKFALIQEF